MHADIDTISGGFNSGHLDPIGFQGQTGSYTDTETLHAANGLFTALSGPGGIYYNPETGVGMAREQADSANEYSGGGTTATVTYFKYDGRGNQTATVDCLGNETDTVYNLADQMTSTIYPATNQTGSGNSQTSIAYEYVGGPADTLSVYDEGNTSGPVRQTTYTYGPEGELLKTSDLKGPVATYQYDGLYRTTAVQDGQNIQNGQSKATYYSYDPIGNLAQTLYPLYSGTGPGAFDTKTYAYDHDSNLLTRTDGNNAVTTYVRDQSVDSRLTGVNYPSGSNTPNVTLGYDVFERLSSLTNSVVAKTYSYDDIDEMMNATVSFTGGPQSQAMNYGYAPDGSRSSLATPLGGYSYQIRRPGPDDPRRLPLPLRRLRQPYLHQEHHRHDPHGLARYFHDRSRQDEL